MPSTGLISATLPTLFVTPRKTCSSGSTGCPRQIKEALLIADVNTCAWCAQIWARQYGVAKAVQLIRDVRYIDDTPAVTPLNGWKSLQQAKGKKR